MRVGKEAEMYIEETEGRARMKIAEIIPILQDLPTSAVQEVYEYLERALMVAEMRLAEARNSNGSVK